MAKRGQKPVSGNTPGAKVPSAPEASGRVFISWSGPQSKRIAEALNDWLPEVIEGVKPWISTHDIGAGQRWGPEINRQLEQTSFGIVCLTRDNLQAPWILFEAGALAKAVDSSRVVPYLFGVPGSDVVPPLGQFNHVSADREGTYRLLHGVNAQYGGKYDDIRLDRKFQKYWPDLERVLAEIPKDLGKNTHRKERELIEELLELARRQSRQKDDIRGVRDAILRLLVPMQAPGYNAIFDSGFNLTEYIGFVPAYEAQKMGDGLLYAYWRSLREHIVAGEFSDDADVIMECRVCEDIERDVFSELKKRLSARLDQLKYRHL